MDSPIQRILIFHRNLPERCGHSLGENASLEEISEQIFFYYCNQPCEEDIELEEAVQFLSLSTALYTLPSSLETNEENEENNSTEIFFGNSTLVFVLLERDILAVVQLARLHKGESGGGNPHAVRSSIERCHFLFSMFRGGGINFQLHNENTSPEQKNSPYQGMDKLYQLRKQSRIINEKISTHKRQEIDYTNLEQQLDSIQREIDSLRDRLPVQAIRRDLDAHYNEYIGDILLVTSRQGGGMRCMVEEVPIPIAQDSMSHLVQSLPFHLDHQQNQKLSLEIQQLMKNCTQDHSDSDPDLLGISTFYHGQLLHTHSLPDAEIQYASSEVICLIMGHFASYRTKMSQLLLHSQNTPTKPKPLLGLTQLFNSDLVKTFDQQAGLESERDRERGTFLPPPPSSMMSVSVGTQYCELLDGRKLWTPNIHIPVFKKEDSRSEDEYIASRTILFEIKGLSFLLYFKASVSNVSLQKTLLAIEESLKEACMHISEDSQSITSAHSDFTILTGNMPGIDLLLVDRAQYKLILYSERNHTVINEKTQFDSKSTPPRTFLGFGSRTTKIRQQSNRNDQLVEWASLGLDCRHLLASHLHLDVILAFDDMMNEVSERRDSKQLTSDSGVFELCTCMTLGWVYACAFEIKDIELYAFFDNSIYVTVADVQIAVGEIKENYLKGNKF